MFKCTNKKKKLHSCTCTYYNFPFFDYRYVQISYYALRVVNRFRGHQFEIHQFYDLIHYDVHSHRISVHATAGMSSYNFP